MEREFIIYLAIMFGVTYLIRVLPLLLINKELENRFIRSFLTYIPYTVLGAMTFPAIIHAVGNPICGAIAAAVGVVLALLGRGLCTVAAGTAIAAYIAMLVF